MSRRAPTPPVECPACGAVARLYTSKTGHGQVWHVHRCSTCGHGFVSNRPTPQTLERIYSTTDDHHPMDDPSSPEARATRDENNRLVDTIVKLTPVRGDSLDIGSGGAMFSHQLHRKGFRPVMIDLDPRAQRAAEWIPGGIFKRTSFEDFEHERPFGAIVMSQVLEHALHPVQWLRKAQGLLSQNGVLAVALPNFAGVYRVLGERDPFLIPPVHLNYFTRHSLERMFRQAGLRPVKFDSSSSVITRHPTKAFSAKRRVLGAAWNAVAGVLDPTALGIILHGYAVRA
jgi:2-polyprenyl-3-methyl-5-hydroxy-6-metoxy-1,4-benzoquinol methylase